MYPPQLGTLAWKGQAAREWAGPTSAFYRTKRFPFPWSRNMTGCVVCPRGFGCCLIGETDLIYLLKENLPVEYMEVSALLTTRGIKPRSRSCHVLWCIPNDDSRIILRKGSVHRYNLVAVIPLSCCIGANVAARRTGPRGEVSRSDDAQAGLVPGRDGGISPAPGRGMSVPRSAQRRRLHWYTCFVFVFVEAWLCPC